MRAILEQYERPAAMSLLRSLVHLVGVNVFLFTSYYTFITFNLPQNEQFRMFHDYGGKFRFLTNWNVLLQTLFYIVCLANDIFGTNDILPKRTPLIRKIKDIFHTSLGFPIAAFVSITFWGLYAVDRELVFPRILDGYFPVWLNHLVHTNILVFTLAEMICSFRSYPRRKKGVTILSTFMLIYLIWTLIIYGKSGRWVYPVMEVLNWPLRICFIFVLLGFANVLYFLGEFLNKIIWGNELRQIEALKRN